MRPEEGAERPLLDPVFGEDPLSDGAGEQTGPPPGEPGAQPRERGEGADGRTTRIDSRFQEVRDSHVHVTGEHHETHNVFQNWQSWSDADESFRDLRLEDLWPRRAERLEEAEGAFAFDAAALTEAMELLLRRRFVVIAGERGLGKFAFAQVLAARLAIREAEIQQSLHCPSFARGLRWRPDRWFDGQSDFGRSILIFEDLFDGGNLDLCRYFARLDPAEVGCLTESLATAGSFLLITCERDALQTRPEHLRSLQVLFEMAPPEGSLLVRAMRRRLGLRNLVESEQEETEELVAKAEELLTGDGERLAERLRTFPRAVRFADEMLLRVACGELTLDGALDALDDLEGWLLHELPERPLQWSFVLALLLASTDPRTLWVPWLFLHEVWREVEAILAEELRWWRDDEVRPVDRLIVDDAFLENVRAQAHRRLYPFGESFRFADPTIHERLWRVLAGPGRALLALLSNRMISWSASESDVFRLVGRYVLGRSGEMAPSHYVLPRIAQLLSGPRNAEGERKPDPELSHLLTGVATSTERAYVEGCLGRVFSAVESNDSRRIGPALNALSGIAELMPDPILDRLERHLKEVLDRTPTSSAVVKKWLEVHDTERRASSIVKRGDRRGTDRTWAAELEDLCLEAVEDPKAELLQGIRYLLVGLCLGEYSTAALSRLATWTGPIDSPLVSWMTLIALHRYGILGTIENFPVRVSYERGEGEMASCRASRLLLALDGPADREALASFLENVYERSEIFPLFLRRVMRARLLRRFENWIAQASELQELREVVVGLAHRLLAGEGALRGDLFRALRRLGESGGAAGDLALEILRGMLPGRRPAERVHA